MMSAERVIEAARELLASKFDTIGKGKRARGIESDDGEKCWIVHSDHIFTLENALAEYDRSASPAEPTRDELREVVQLLARQILNVEMTMSQHREFADALLAYIKSAASPALSEIAVERRRQMEVEGWTPEHDDEHDMGELALAAGCYAIHAGGRQDTRRSVHPDDNSLDDRPVYVPRSWPHQWAAKWWKPKDPRRDLIRAAALIVAEIERLDRAAASPKVTK